MTWSCESNFRSNLSHFWEITRTRQVWTVVSGLGRDPDREKVPTSSLGALKYDVRHAALVESRKDVTEALDRTQEKVRTIQN